MGFFGNLIGQGLGALGSHVLPIPGVNGRELGGALGGMLPFARGGIVPKYKKGGRVQRKRKTKGRK
jgi:hypothetical protein